MDFGQYADAARETAIYPDAGTGSAAALAYCGLGAAGEAGEIANKVKKVLRDDGGQLTPDRREQIAGEIGGTLWYLDRLAEEIGLSLATVAELNAMALRSRAQRGALRGDGDTR